MIEVAAYLVVIFIMASLVGWLSAEFYRDFLKMLLRWK